MLCCGCAGSSLDVKIETVSIDALGIKTEADSDDITEHHPDDTLDTGVCGLHYAVNCSICIYQCVCPSVSTLVVAFLDRFSPKLAQT